VVLVFVRSPMATPAEPASEISSLKFIKGDPITLAQAKGKVVVLEFWATWCPPCRSSIPHLTEIAHRFNDLIVIGITSEPEQKAKPFVDQMGSQMDYRVAIDEQGDVNNNYMAKYKQSGIPCAFVIDKQSRVVFVGHPMDGTFEQAIRKAISEANGPSAPAVDVKKLSRDQLMAMKVSELKQILSSLHGSFQDINEKEALVDRILASSH